MSLLKGNFYVYCSFALIAFGLGVCFADGLVFMEKAWQSEEYSHGYLIPVISFWFIWQNREKLQRFIGPGNWYGVLIVLIGLLLGLIGELATLFVIIQYAFLLTLLGLALAFLGWKGVMFLWFPLAYLFFMIPLPTFLYNNLSSQLQLISSQLGVAVIRLFDISVFLQGNVIDLGVYRLQVVEACNGLRYLFPLTSFGFLCAYLFRAPIWMRLVIFLSTLPITVIMNSLRIGVIGVLVEYWGIEQAEGFLHDFEGWIIFVGCLAILFLEMWLMVKFFMRDQQFSDVFVVDGAIEEKNAVEFMKPSSKSDSFEGKSDHMASAMMFGLPKPFISAMVLLLVLLPLTLFIGDRDELSPERKRFSSFPLQIAEWKGVDVGMEQEYIDALKFDDYIVGNFKKNGDRNAINFYVAYYASQRKGASVHSPKSCMPGGGWRIGEFGQRRIANTLNVNGQPLEVNRTVIKKGEHKQLVYYWFQQRGRIITNEYLVKWYLFWDALTKQRTDGALVRLVTALPDGMEVEEGDKKLEEFLKVTFPKLAKFVPA